MAATQTIPQPDWLDKHHSEWPPEARMLFTILGNIAERHLAHTADQKQPETAPKTAVAG